MDTKVSETITLVQPSTVHIQGILCGTYQQVHDLISYSTPFTFSIILLSDYLICFRASTEFDVLIILMKSS